MADHAAIVQFNQAMARETEGKELDYEKLSIGVRSLLGSENKGFYIVATCKGETAGCLLITTEWSDWRNAYFWWIQSVYVLPRFRRQNVYSKMHRFIENEARKRPDVCGLRLYVDGENITAQKVYDSLGMHPSRYLMYEREFQDKPPF